MSQLDDPRNELCNMRYFTPDLIERLNSSDSAAVDTAMEQWEAALVSYRESLQKILHKMPTQSRPLVELSLHDWDLFYYSVLDGAAAVIVLKQDKNFVILSYLLSQKLQRIASPKRWSLSKKQVHWLYDELDADGKKQESFVHRILFSDGTTLFVPFSDCRVAQVKSDHAMSHSDLMQIA